MRLHIHVKICAVVLYDLSMYFWRIVKIAVGCILQLDWVWGLGFIEYSSTKIKEKFAWVVSEINPYVFFKIGKYQIIG